LHGNGLDVFFEIQIFKQVKKLLNIRWWIECIYGTTTYVSNTFSLLLHWEGDTDVIRKYNGNTLAAFKFIL